MRESNQEWSKETSWKTALKKYEVIIVVFKQTTSLESLEIYLPETLVCPVLNAFTVIVSF